MLADMKECMKEQQGQSDRDRKQMLSTSIIPPERSIETA